MERSKALQILLPAAAVAAVVLLIGVLIAIGDSDTTSTSSTQKSPTQDGEPPFPLEAPDWKPVDNAMYPGLMYWDTKEGSGEPCPSGATVTIHYSGYLKNGTKFDSSYKTGKPATFPLSNLIRGWQAGIPGMKPGTTRRLKIPFEYGYGVQGSVPNIPPKALLLFEIEMISFSN